MKNKKCLLFLMTIFMSQCVMAGKVVIDNQSNQLVNVWVGEYKMAFTSKEPYKVGAKSLAEHQTTLNIGKTYIALDGVDSTKWPQKALDPNNPLGVAENIKMIIKKDSTGKFVISYENL